MLIHDNRLLQWLERKKKPKKQSEDSRIFFTFYYFARFLVVSENNPAMEFYYCAYCCLCLSECIFSWVESQVLRAGSKKKKMKVYFVLYKC